MQKRPTTRTPRIYCAHECQVRDVYCRSLPNLRPDKRLVKTELRYATAARRVDMRTVDRFGTFREWEFKIRADQRTLGQLLIYLAHARRELAFRPIRGVIAAFEIPEELRLGVEVMSLSIEFVTIPAWMSGAGFVPATTNCDMKPTKIVTGDRTK